MSEQFRARTTRYQEKCEPRLITQAHSSPDRLYKYHIHTREAALHISLPQVITYQFAGLPYTS